MEEHLRSQPYQSIADRTGRQLLKQSFAMSKKAVLTEGFQSGMLTSNAQMLLLKIGKHYGFPEFKAGDSSGIPFKVFLSGIKALAERGERIWHEH